VAGALYTLVEPGQTVLFPVIEQVGIGFAVTSTQTGELEHPAAVVATTQ
jgi:hypothetical protein